LQDPNNRRNILCDEPLRALFGVNTINMFQMNKVLAKHIWPLDSDDGMILNLTLPSYYFFMFYQNKMSDIILGC
jgi:upstream activation factor subunit UAF30